MNWYLLAQALACGACIVIMNRHARRLRP